jgi:thiol-disulfide isomerase/thioredoxin
MAPGPRDGGPSAASAVTWHLPACEPRSRPAADWRVGSSPGTLAPPTRFEVTVQRVLPLLGALMLLLVACSSGGDAQAADCDLPGVRPGLCPTEPEERSAAPEAALPVVGEPEREVSVGDFRGDVVVVNFWASWCGPCRVEQPDLNEAHEILEAEGVSFLGVNIEDTEPNALAHIREFSIPYDSVYDGRNQYASQFRGVSPRTIPTTIFLDRDGKVAARLFGSPRDATEIVALAEHVAGAS